MARFFTNTIVGLFGIISSRNVMLMETIHTSIRDSYNIDNFVRGKKISCAQNLWNSVVNIPCCDHIKNKVSVNSRYYYTEAGMGGRLRP
jgi:hypothetical protein